MSMPLGRFVELCKIASDAADRGDWKTIETLNNDPELIEVNAIFIVRDGSARLGDRARLERERKERGEL